MSPIVVLGGGISGLALALELERRGREVVVLEAADHPGGTIGTGREDGWQWETGPNGALDREGALLRLAGELGLEDQLEPAAPAAKRRYIFAHGRLWSVSPSALLLGGLLSWQARLRLLAEPFSGRAPAGSDETIAEFGRRHVGAEAVRLLLDPMVTGIYGGDVEALSLRACFPRMAELEERSRSLVLGAFGALARARRERRQAVGARLTSLRGGMRTLIEALAGRLGERLRLGAEVVALERAPTAGSAWRVRTRQGELSADAVALCLPAYHQATLVTSLDAEAARDLAAIPYVPMAVVHLGFAEPTGRWRGFGFLAASSEKLPVLGAIFASELFPARAPDAHALYTCMIGGAHHPEDTALADGELVERARQGLARALGLVHPPLFARVCRWPRAIPQYRPGHLARLARLDEAERRLPGLFFAGNALRGISVADCLRQAPLLAAKMTTDLPRQA